MKRILLITLLLVAGLVVLGLWLPQDDIDQELSAIVPISPMGVEGFTRSEGIPSLNFPADFGAHPDFQSEWWYYTGNLESADGRHFGYELTFFRRALLPADQVPERESAWASNQIYMAHFALTDVEGDAFYAYERFSRGALGLAGASGAPYAVWLEDWRVEQTGPDNFHLTASTGELAIDLDLVSEKDPVLHGELGYSRKGHEAGNASYYYSQTRLASQGRVRIGEEDFQVSGLSWKDHEFSTSALTADQQGWDWFSIQLDNGYDLMLYQVRRTDGSIDPFSNGTWIAPDGSTTQLALGDFEIEASGEWRSPHSEALYPMGWTIRIPQLDLELQVSPYIEDQELNLAFIYWEGAAHVEGAWRGAAIGGQGYVEMTGYAEVLGGQF
jgi:predicted secreted hydrolase